MSGTDATETFRQEAQELLEILEQALLDLEHTPGDMELVDTAFRALHTIKGSGAMFGFDAVAGFTHHVETAFDLVRKGKVIASRELIAVTLSAKDRMRLLIEHPEAADALAEGTILAELKAIVDGVQAPAPSPAQPDLMTWRIKFRLAENAMTMGTNPILLLEELRGLGTAVVTALSDTVPPLEAMVPTNCYLAWEVVLTTSHQRAAIEDVFLFVIDDMELEIVAVEPNGKARQVDEQAIDRSAVKPDLVAAVPPEPPSLQMTPVRSGGPGEDRPLPAAAEPQQARNETKVAKVADSIRVPAERLDDMMDRVGELMIAQSRLSQVAANSNDAQVKSIGRGDRASGFRVA